MALNYETTNWENGKTVLKAEHLRKIEKGITDIIAENDAIYTDEDTRKSNEKQRQEEHSRKMNEVSEVVSDIQKDYDSLQKIIIDENASANLQKQINSVNSQLEHIATMPSSTKSLQDFFNNISNNSTIKIPKGTYDVDNVLIIQNKENVKIDLSDCIFHINKHGFGIFELSNCKNITIKGGVLIGSGNFPPNTFEGETLHNEKHDYKDVWGFYRNGKLTSTPSYNNGNLGNCGIGLLIHNGCETIVVSNLKVSGFNYVGLGVGFLGDGNSEASNVAINKNITIKNCELIENFCAGMHIMACDGYVVENNRIERNGHSSANASDRVIDPGYGITLRGSYYHAKNGTIINNYFRGNKRKGIDSHASENTTVINNNVFDSLVGGIVFVTQGSYTTKNYKILNNHIENCGNSYTNESNRGIQAGGNTTAIVKNNTIINCANLVYDNRVGIDCPLGTKIIEDNTIINSGSRASIYAYTNRPHIINNKIIDKTYTNGYGIFVAKGTGVEVEYANIQDNFISNVYTGFRLENITNGLLSNNTLENITKDVETNGSNNILVKNNQGFVWANVINRNGFIFHKESHVAQINITNGVASFTKLFGDIIESITEIEKGIRINLKRDVLNPSINFMYGSSGDRNSYPNIYTRSYGKNYIDLGIANALGGTGVPLSNITKLLITVDISCL